MNILRLNGIFVCYVHRLVFEPKTHRTMKHRNIFSYVLLIIFLMGCSKGDHLRQGDSKLSLERVKSIHNEVIAGLNSSSKPSRSERIAFYTDFSKSVADISKLGVAKVLKNNDINPVSFSTYKYYVEHKNKKDLDIYDLAVEKFSDEPSVKYFFTLVAVRNLIEKTRNDHFQAFSARNMDEHYADYQTRIDGGLVDVSSDCWGAMISFGFSFVGFAFVGGPIGAIFAVANFGYSYHGLYSKCRNQQL